MSTPRIKQDWMDFSQKEIDECLSDDSWEHYKGGGCLCEAREPSECMCGSWHTDLADQ